VYPAEPPIVTVESLRGLPVRQSSARMVVWVFDATTAEPDTARLLADHRDALRAHQIAILGLYCGPISDWSGRVLPMLRVADANYPCAVLEPTDRSAVGLWLSQEAHGPSAGLYVLASSGQLGGRADLDQAGMRAWLADLGADVLPAEHPAGLRQLRAARVRVLDLTSGRVLATAQARAEEPSTLARLLAAQLRRTLADPPLVAILPLRQTDRGADPNADAPDQGLLLAEQLGRALSEAGWSRLVAPREAVDVLAETGSGALAAEFTPEALARETPWQAILVGTTTAESP